MVEDLADPAKALCGKNKDAALQLKHQGNRGLFTGDFPGALASYTQVTMSFKQGFPSKLKLQKKKKNKKI